jgi:hypothetical protein
MESVSIAIAAFRRARIRPPFERLDASIRSVPPSSASRDPELSRLETSIVSVLPTRFASVLPSFTKAGAAIRP